jgi:hypothetical protein
MDADERSETVVLDLVNPALARGRLGREHRHLGRDERRYGRSIAGHAP